MKYLFRGAILLLTFALFLAAVWGLAHLTNALSTPTNTRVLVYLIDERDVDSSDLALAVEEIRDVIRKKGLTDVEVTIAESGVGIELHIPKRRGWERDEATIRDLLRSTGRVSFRQVVNPEQDTTLRRVFSDEQQRQKFGQLAARGLFPDLESLSHPVLNEHGFELHPVDDRMAVRWMADAPAHAPPGMIVLRGLTVPRDEAFAFSRSSSNDPNANPEVHVFCHKPPVRQLAMARGSEIHGAAVRSRDDGLCDVEFESYMSFEVMSWPPVELPKTIVLLINGRVSATVEKMSLGKYRAAGSFSKTEALGVAELLSSGMLQGRFRPNPVRVFERAPDTD